jgi:hypothetical protein
MIIPKKLSTHSRFEKEGGAYIFLQDDEGFLQFTVASVGAGHDLKLNK